MDYQNRDTLTARLLKWGYPILLSNRVDPFAASNYRQALPLIEMLSALGIPLQFQTRGGLGVNDALSFIEPSVFYVSFVVLKEAQRAIIEPGATKLNERLDMVGALIDAGHEVIVGLNPAVPEWSPDPGPLLVELKRLGVHGVWIERIHFNYLQERAMKPGEKLAIGQAIIDRGRKRYTPKLDFDHFMKCRDLARVAGLEVFSLGQSEPTDFFTPYRKLYSKTFPIYPDFINALALGGYGPGDPITFNQFATFMTDQLPEGEQPIAHYLGATSRDLFRRRKIPHNMSYRDLLEIIWTEPKTKFSLVRSPAFAYAARRAGDGWIMWTDADDLPLLVYNEAGFTDYFQEVEL